MSSSQKYIICVTPIPYLGGGGAGPFFPSENNSQQIVIFSEDDILPFLMTFLHISSYIVHHSKGYTVYEKNSFLIPS
jgi:hypothetical protein